MIICHCKVVTTRSVEQALDAGACTTAQVCRHTEAGRDCGACVSTIRSLVLRHREGPAAAAVVPGRLGRYAGSAHS